MTRDFWKGFRLGVWLPMLIGGALFMPAAYSGDFFMDEVTYGKLVLSIPAELWATVLFGSSFFYIVFLFINGRLWWSWIVRVIASLFGAGKMTLFSVSAYGSAGHDVVVMFGGAFAAAIMFAVYIDAREAVAGGGRVGRVRN